MSPPPAASPATPPSPTKPCKTRVSSSLASALREATAVKPPPRPEGGICAADGFDAGRELVLRSANVRRVVPERILSVRILPLADRTVVAAARREQARTYRTLGCGWSRGG